MTEYPQLSFSSPGDPLDVLLGESEMGRLMRSIDWAGSLLGPVDRWSQSLRTAVSICLNSRFPILIWWGPELIMLYNDAYRPMLGATKHPRAMGQRGRDSFPEIWAIIGPMLEGVIQRGQATWSEDQLLLLDRNGFLEECYFTFSYSPIHDENGIGGVFTAVTETTGRVVSERRMRILASLSTQLTSAEPEESICRIAMQTLALNRQDIPFAALYLLDSVSAEARLVEQTGLSAQAPALPPLAAGGTLTASTLPRVLPLEGCRPDDAIHRLFGLDPETQPVQPIAQMEVLPVGGAEQPLGFLVAGLSPYRPWDDDYRNFLALAAGQIAAALTTARALEAERRRAKALAELDRAKTEFFSNVSHEFRTPLTLMLGPLEDLLYRGDALPPAQRETLEMAHRNGLRLLKLVNTLLDFSRMEAGRVAATYQPVDLAAMTADLASVFRSTVENANLRLVVDCPPLPQPIYVDRDMWEKIVLNLISNAFKFTFEGQITVSLAWQGQGVELRVADTGAGIAPEEIPHIFDRFHRVQDARSRSVEGSGIGLALVKELVRLHGGAVSVTSAPGQGSTFSVWLPAGSAHLPPDQIRAAAETGASVYSTGPLPYVEEAKRWLSADLAPVDPLDALSTDAAGGGAPQADALPEGGRGARILLADDNADMRDYLRRLLSGRWEVETAGDGASALRAIQANRPDLVLSDIMMPEMDGFALLRRLRADPATRDLPVILISARAGEEARIEGLERGADDYLVKPFPAREMIARIEARLELVRMRSETRRRITTILDSFTDAFWALGHDWCINYANRQAAQRMGLAPGDLPGMDLRPYLASALDEPNRQALERAMAERVPVRFECFQAAAGLWFEYRAYPYEAGLAIHAVDITERKATAAALKQSETRFVEKMTQAEVQRRLMEYREKERQGIARDIHDGPIQSLVGIIFNVQLLKDSARDGAIWADLEKFNSSLRSVVRELREVVNELRPPALIQFGLAKAMRVYTVDFLEKHPELDIHLDLDEDGARLSEPVCLALYRVYQEELNNIARHAGASEVWVHFYLSDEELLFTIQDNGKGFTVPDDFVDQTKKGHYGMAGMKERVDAIHGQMQILSAPGQGTTLRIAIRSRDAVREKV